MITVVEACKISFQADVDCRNHLRKLIWNKCVDEKYAIQSNLASKDWKSTKTTQCYL